MRKYARRNLVAYLLAAFVVLTALPNTGCYGQFAATKKLHAWNGGISNKFLRTFAFWGLIIIPVYELVALGDGLIFNVIEFWGGKNPIGGKSAALIQPDGSIVYKRGKVAYMLEPIGKRSFALVVGGRRVAVARVTRSGGLLLRQEGGRKVRFISRARVDELKLRINGH